MQQESNACLHEGMDVYYVSSGSSVYDAQVKRIHEHDYCDLYVFGPIGEKSTFVMYQAAYDSDGEQRHSWHKKSDITSKGM